MTFNLESLREQRNSAWDKMKGYNDEAIEKGWSGELTASYEKAEADYDKLDADVERMAKFAEVEAKNAAVDRRGVIAPTADTVVDAEKGDAAYASAFKAYLSKGMGGVNEVQRNALSSGFSEIQNALSVGTNTAGGYLVPPGYRDEFIKQMKAFGNVQAEAQVIQTDSGQPLQWPTMNDTGNVGRLLAENTQMTETDVVFGTATLGAFVYSSDLTRVSLQLANDSAFSTEDTVRAAHAERIGRILNQHFTTGTGTSQPQGIVTGATTGVTAASTTAFTSDELIDLQHSVDPAYRNERSKFMLNDTALKAVRKLKYSGSGEYIFQPGGRNTAEPGNVPGLIVGQPYVINQDMVAPATGVKSVLYGDFQAGYVVRIVQGIQVITFTERYLDYLQLGHSSFMRADGRVQNTSAYKALAQA